MPTKKKSTGKSPRMKLRARTSVPPSDPPPEVNVTSTEDQELLSVSSNDIASDLGLEVTRDPSGRLSSEPRTGTTPAQETKTSTGSVEESSAQKKPNPPAKEKKDPPAQEDVSRPTKEDNDPPARETSLSLVKGKADPPAKEQSLISIRSKKSSTGKNSSTALVSETPAKRKVAGNEEGSSADNMVDLTEETFSDDLSGPLRIDGPVVNLEDIPVPEPLHRAKKEKTKEEEYPLPDLLPSRPLSSPTAIFEQDEEFGRDFTLHERILARGIVHESEEEPTADQRTPQTDQMQEKRAFEFENDLNWLATELQENAAATLSAENARERRRWWYELSPSDCLKRYDHMEPFSDMEKILNNRLPTWVSCLRFWTDCWSRETPLTTSGMPIGITDVTNQ